VEKKIRISDSGGREKVQQEGCLKGESMLGEGGFLEKMSLGNPPKPCCWRSKDSDIVQEGHPLLPKAVKGV